MALHYILDGYNVIHQIPSLAEGTLEARRAGLIRILEVQNPQGSRRNAVTVVFDGQAGLGVRHESSSARVMFSSEESADETIKHLVETSDQRKSIVVVTDDKAVRFYVRKLGAEVMPVAEFFGKARGTSDGRTGKKSPAESKQIPYSDEAQITSELEGIWLKKKPKKR